MTTTRRLEIFRQGAFAGAAGGSPEVAWVMLYTGVTGADPAVLRAASPRPPEWARYCRHRPWLSVSPCI